MHDNDKEIRIDELKRQAGQMGMKVSWESDALPVETRERFWRQVVDFETAPMTTLLQQLRDAGCEVPEPESMTDDQLSAKLVDVIDALARLRVFLEFTDHMSDRALYTRLLREQLVDEIPWPPGEPQGVWQLTFSTGSEEDTDAYLRYYADEDERRWWQVEFPDYEMPPHEELPYDRDRHLPGAYDDADAEEAEGAE